MTEKEMTLIRQRLQSQYYESRFAAKTLKRYAPKLRAEGRVRAYRLALRLLGWCPKKQKTT